MAKKTSTKNTVTRSAKATSLRGKKAPVDKVEQATSSVWVNNLPEFKAGDKIVVKSKIKEGDKERVQAFEGVVMSRKGRGVAETFTVRKISAGVGVERVFPLHSNRIESIEVKTEGFVRRAKMYYLRELEGRKARIQDKNLKLQHAQGAEQVGAAASTDATPTT